MLMAANVRGFCLILLFVVALDALFFLHWGRPTVMFDVIGDHSPQRVVQACTKESADWPKRETLQITDQKYDSVVAAVEVLGFIITELDIIGAPVIFMFGTALHEYRNGTGGPCVVPNYEDKDFDVAVFAEHYHFILTLEQDIMDKFNWTFWNSDRSKGRLFTSIYPAGGGEYLAIDVYGFVCNKSNNLVYFPWDVMMISRNSFLPARKHKSILSQSDSVNGSNEKMHVTKSSWRSINNPGFYMPFDPPCLLHNIYGSDYMTPKRGKSSQAKWRSRHGSPSFDNPKCNATLTALEEDKLERQLSFCSGTVPPPKELELPRVYETYRYETLYGNESTRPTIRD